jgi:saccharopepsin
MAGVLDYSTGAPLLERPLFNPLNFFRSGTSYSYASEEFCRNLYSPIPGAKFSSAIGQWVVPCKEQVNLGFTIGGRRFPVHPLDIISPSLTATDNTTCYGTFIPQSFSVGVGEFDLLLGDMFLRNVYSLYDLGDFMDDKRTMGNPYIKLLSITNATAASEEFHRLRGGTANEANNISNAQSSLGSVFSSSTVSVNSETLDRLVRYAEIILSLLAISTTLLVSAVGIMVYFVFFKRRRNASTRPSPDESSLSSYGLGHLRAPGPSYQQVPSVRNSEVS